MDLFFNDLSIHGQFPDFAAFHVAIGRVMSMRELARHQYGQELQCHRNVTNAQVTHDSSMLQAIQGLSKEKRSALMQWLSQSDASWEDFRQHSEDDWLEYNGEVVTGDALGEAAYRLFHNIECSLVSMDPSSWCYSPLPVEWHESTRTRSKDVPNYWDSESLTAALENSVTLASWGDLERVAQMRCPGLTISQNCFEQLHRHPFGKGAAQALLSRLTVLHDFKNHSNEHGRRTREGHEMYQRYFTGTWFSDSSESEKRDFQQALTFCHPSVAGETLFCPWHGKVKTSQLRIHFSWPVSAATPLYVVYVGPKITKR